METCGIMLVSPSLYAEAPEFFISAADSHFNNVAEKGHAVWAFHCGLWLAIEMVTPKRRGSFLLPEGVTMFRSRHKQDSKWRSEMVRDIPKEPGIYLIECTANGKKYIGATVNLYKRIYEHLANMSMEGHHSSFGNDYLDYGRDSFRVEILEYVNDRALLADREAYWHQQIGNNLCNIEPPKKHWLW